MHDDEVVRRVQAREANVARLYQQAEGFYASADAIQRELDRLKAENPMIYQIKLEGRQAAMAEARARGDEATRQAEQALARHFIRTLPEGRPPPTLVEEAERWRQRLQQQPALERDQGRDQKL